VTSRRSLACTAKVPRRSLARHLRRAPHKIAQGLGQDSDASHPQVPGGAVQGAGCPADSIANRSVRVGAVPVWPLLSVAPSGSRVSFSASQVCRPPVGGLVSVPRTYYRYYYYACTGGTRWVGERSFQWQLELCFRDVSGVASTGCRRRQSPGSRSGWVGKRPSH
jgi:hypothetical protein